MTFVRCLFCKSRDMEVIYSDENLFFCNTCEQLFSSVHLREHIENMFKDWGIANEQGYGSTLEV